MPVKRDDIAGPFSSLGLKLLFSRYNRLHIWDYDRMKAPYWRCFIPLDPGGEVRFKDRIYRLERGECMLIPPYTTCRTHAREAFRKVHCHFTCDLAIRPGVYVSALSRDGLSELEDLLEDLVLTAPEYGVQEARLNFYMVNCLSSGILKISQEAFIENALFPENIRLVLAHMQNFLGDVWSNKQLAKLIGMHENSFIHYFTSQVKVSPQKYYLRLRLEQAAMQLTQTDMTIDEIARDCGFWDRNHLTRAFTKEWQCPPATFRKQDRQSKDV